VHSTRIHQGYAGLRILIYDKVHHISLIQSLILENLSLEKFIGAIEEGTILIDFDARTGHNHGTKFRMRQNKLPQLYERVIEISD